MAGWEKCEGCGLKYYAEDGHKCKPSAVSAGALTEREKWLMRKAYVTGFSDRHTGIRCDLDSWLANSSVDGVTVEMVLAKEAP